MDEMVLETQQWLNSTYGSDARFDRVPEHGVTGWPTIYGLLRGLQIELGIQETADSFGPTTRGRFTARFPNGVTQQTAGATATSRVYTIIQGALWCKGYSTGSHLTQQFFDGTGRAISQLKGDAGLSDSTSTATLPIMQALLSMNQFVLLRHAGGRESIRSIQQRVNNRYGAYVGIVPTDGLYGREVNDGMIRVLQAIEGFTPSEATGNFGDGTRARLRTLTAANASTLDEWLWLAWACLICNGHDIAQPTNGWTTEFGNSVGNFQMHHALPRTTEVDPTTWMSLLTSKGDPDRPAIGCDTRFEATDQVLDVLTGDGYQIIGRYLSERDQEVTAPDEYWRAIRNGELERILQRGMRFFPIYQEAGDFLESFTHARGYYDAHRARESAHRLGIPPTVIYFAVDADIIDEQIDSHVIPYFQQVNRHLGGGYQVGAYGARNICSRLTAAGLSVSSFVSDMSTGYSGNLGFPIPQNWNYDQFTEIGNYRGYGFDLDRVAHSGRIPAVSYVHRLEATSPNSPIHNDYTRMSPIDLIERFERRFEELRAIGRVGFDVLVGPRGESIMVDVPTYRCILNYLAKNYLRGEGVEGQFRWAVAAEPFRIHDANVLESDTTASAVIAALDRYIGNRPQAMHDMGNNPIDLPHLSVTCVGYLAAGPIPDEWTGWAGDLATLLGEMRDLARNNPSSDLDLFAIADALLGASDRFYESPAFRNLTLQTGGWWLQNTFGIADLNADADAITFANRLSVGDQQDSRLLSRTMRGFYRDSTQVVNRYRVLAQSVNTSTVDESSTEFFNRMVALAKTFLNQLGGQEIPDAMTVAACRSLANRAFHP